MMKVTEKDLGFEVLRESDENIVFKRVLRGNASLKIKQQRDTPLATVTVHYFDRHDMEKLQEIQVKVADKYVLRKNGRFVLSLKAIKRFLHK